MSAITFDTLSASRKLCDAGVDERTAEAIVEAVKQTTVLPSWITSSARMSSRRRWSRMRTRPTWEALAALTLVNRADLAALELRISEKIRGQGLALIGSMAAIVAIAAAVIKLV